MHMVLVVGLRHSRFSYLCSDFKKWCHGDRSRALLVPDAHPSTVRPTIPLCLPLMVSWTASIGDLAMVTWGLPRPVVAPVLRVLGSGGASLGAAVVGVVGTGPS
jgi:hypothetical protein